MWYAVGVAVRNLFYSLGLKKQEAPHITTIGVGNLSTGGTGKTPHVEYLLELLANRYSTAMLSRGYKRKSKGFVLDDGSHDATLLGDEPAMIASKHPQVQVAVCEQRIEGVRRLMEEPPLPADEEEEPRRPLELVVLDDVFQHRRIKPSINILLTEYRHPYFKDYILPYGNLREFRSGRYRASNVIVTKSPARLNPIEKHNIINDLKLQNYQKVFFSYLQYGEIQTLDGQPAGIDLRRIDRVLAVTGIAHPEPMIDELRRNCKLQHMCFADHHNYTQRERRHPPARTDEGPARLYPARQGSVPQRRRPRLRPRHRVFGTRKHLIPQQAQHLELDQYLKRYITPIFVSTTKGNTP